MKIKYLALLLVALLAVYLTSYFMDENPNETTMDSQLLDTDTSEVTAVSFFPESTNRKEIRLERAGDNWIVIHEGKEYPAEESSIQAVLGELANLKADRLVGTNFANWEKFELNPEKATSLRVEKDGELVGDFLVGGFTYNQELQIPSSYVRRNNDAKSYVVRGYLSMTFDRELALFRKRTITNFDKSLLTKVQFNYPADSSFTLTTNSGYWFKDMVATDSIAAANYLSSLSKLGSNGFVDDEIDFNELTKTHSIVIEGNGIETIEISNFSGHPVFPSLITASNYEGAVFNGNGAEFFNKNFVSPTRFDIK